MANQRMAGDRISGKEVRQMRANHRQKGEGTGNVRDTYSHFQEQAASGREMSQRAQNQMNRMGERIDRLDARKAAKGKSKGQPAPRNTQPAPGTPDDPMVHIQPVQPPQQGQQPPGTDYDYSVENTFGVGRDLNQNVGKKGDTNTTIGDNNTIGHGATIGGDYSVTIGGNSAGNGQGGSGTGNVQGGMNNMQLGASYNALNDNAYHKSSAQLNGAGAAAQASAAAAEITGAQDRVANLYNATGMDQNYWRQKANAQSNFYLGDIFKEGFGGYDWTMPDAPNKIEDSTADIYDDAKEEMKDI